MWGEGWHLDHMRKALSLPHQFTKEKIWDYKTVPSQESVRSSICVLTVSILHLSTMLFLDLELSRECGILELFRECGILEQSRECGALELFRQYGILELLRQYGILELVRKCGILELFR